MSTVTKTRPWRDQIIEQLADIPASEFPADFTHAVIHRTADTATLLDTCVSEAAAVVSAEDHQTKTAGGEVTVVPRAEIEAGFKNPDSSKAKQKIDEPAEGTDPDAGKLFEVPRVGVIIDETDPTVLKLSFSGSIELNRANASDVKFFNKLKAGKTVALEVEAHCAGAKTTHRRDSEGNVDAVVQTKSLLVHSIDGV